MKFTNTIFIIKHLYLFNYVLRGAHPKGFTEDIMVLEPYKEKWKAFGWEVREIDGHNIAKITSTLKDAPFKKGKPSLIIAKTVKGKGISFMENNPEWHGKALKGGHADIAHHEVHKALGHYKDTEND